MKFIYGLTDIEEVIAIYKKAVSMKTAGTVIVSFSDSGTTVSKQIFIDPDKDVEDCVQFIQAVRPDLYPQLFKSETVNYY